jgi:two-component system sensor histidine kinase DegS
MATTRVPPKIGWARRYRAALRKYLAQGPGSSLQPALGLGRQAVALGLETLDVARFHEQALTTVVSPGGSSRTRQRMIERAKSFFAETIVPIEKTHRAALKADVRVNQLTQTLRRRTVESSASNRRLKRSIIQRQGVEESLKKSGAHHTQLLAESHRLQKHLRHLTREILSAQEDERQKTSHQLHDKVAQTLIAIDLPLLTLKKAARVSTASLKKEIANTRRMVKESAKRLKRFAHEFVVQHKT